MPPARPPAVLRELAGVLVPVQCPGCGRWDTPLCAGCRALLEGPLAAGPPRRRDHDAPALDLLGAGAVGRLPVWSVADYVGPVRGVVVAWKDRGRADLGAPLGAVAHAAARALAPLLTEVVGSEPLLVVPVPSSAAARRRRGGDLVAGLAAHAAAGLRAGGVTAQDRRAMRHVGRVRDQVGLGARTRGRNVAGSLRARARGTDPDMSGGRTAWVLLVDDVLTTGSTLRAADRAMTSSGTAVVGALTLAATPPPGAPGRRLPRPTEQG